MIERHRVVEKVVELMDQIGDMQVSLFTYTDLTSAKQAEQGILTKALIVDHLMWVLDLGDPKLPGAFLVREEHAKYEAEKRE